MAMKKIISALLSLLISLGLAYSQEIVKLKTNVCAFSKPLNTKEINTWEAHNQTLEYVKKICDIAFIDPNFKVMRANVDIAIATVDDNNNRFIYYSSAFFHSLQNETDKVAILAHEIGHHINNHTFSKNDRRPTDELIADQFAGSILCKLGYKVENIRTLLSKHTSLQGDENYPARSARIEAFTFGYEKANCFNTSIIYERKFDASDFRLNIDNINHFNYEEFSIDKLNINQDFILKFRVKSYKAGGSTRYGLAWNFISGGNFMLFTIHTKNSGYYSIGPGNNPNYKPYSRFKEGAFELNGENNYDELQIKKVSNDLIFLINENEVWRTSSYKLNTNRFAFWVADVSDAALLSATATQ